MNQPINQPTDRPTATQVIHAVLPDGSTIKGVEVFRAVYSAIGLGWVYAGAYRTCCFGGAGGDGCEPACLDARTLMLPLRWHPFVPFRPITPHSPPHFAATKLPLIGGLADAAYDLWAVNRLKITGRPELEEILKERQAKIKATDYSDCEDECEIDFDKL